MTLAGLSASAAVFEAPPAPLPFLIGSLKVTVSCERPQGAGLPTSHASDRSGALAASSVGRVVSVAAVNEARGRQPAWRRSK